MLEWPTKIPPPFQHLDIWMCKDLEASTWGLVKLPSNTQPDIQRRIRLMPSSFHVKPSTDVYREHSQDGLHLRLRCMLQSAESIA